MPLRYLGLTLLLFVLGPPYTSAQDRAPDLSPSATQQMLRRYAQQQRETAEGLASVTLPERLTMTWDAPFGRREVVVEAMLTGGTAQRAWQREVVRVTGEPKPHRRGGARHSPHRPPPGRGTPPRRGGPPPRGEHRPPHPGDADPTQDERLRTPIRRLLQPERVGPVRFGHLRPAAGATTERVDGVTAWRIGLLPERKGLLQQATVWIAQDDGRLLRARYTLHSDDRAAPIEVSTWFTRQGGLDVPRARVVTSTEQVRRRLRTFTVRFRAEALYDEARLERE